MKNSFFCLQCGVLMLFLMDCLSVYAYYDQGSGLYFNIISESDKTVSVSYGHGGYVYIPSSITIPAKKREKKRYWHGPSGDHNGSDDGYWFYEWVWTDYGTTYTVTEIGNYAFSDCYNLYSVRIPSTVRRIGNYAFYNCSELCNVTIPEIVTQIGNYAFYGCDKLKSVSSYSYTPPYMYNEWCFSKKAYDNSALYVPYPSMKRYSKADWWKNFWLFEELATKFHEGFDSSFGKTKPRGVTADGASKMFIYFDRNDIKGISSWEIKTSIDEQQVKDVALTGNFGELKKLENGKYGFDYCAPEDFPEAYKDRNLYEVHLEVRAIDVEGDSIKGKADITVMRTGVLLIHGLWGNRGVFSGLKGYLLEAGYTSSQIVNCGYFFSSGESFENNTFTNAVVQGHMEQLFRQLSDDGIISSKFDLVGHSMGGILSRLYAQEVNPKAVNRIITLDTPHSGSQLAYLRDNILERLIKLSVQTHNLKLALATGTLYYMFTNGSQAAIENLRPSSAAIARLNDPGMMSNAIGIPVHTISSSMFLIDAEETGTNLGVLCDASTAYVAFNDVIVGGDVSIKSHSVSGYNILEKLFNGSNDGVVSVESQSGGLFGSQSTIQSSKYSGPFGVLSLAHHLNTNKWELSYSNITNLLKTPKSSSVFSTDGFDPIVLTSHSNANRIPEHMGLKDATESSFIHLNIERIDSLRAIDVKVTASDDVESYIAYAVVDDDKMIFSNNQPESRFIIPDYYEGNLNITVLGRTRNDEIVIDSDSTMYYRTSPLYSLYFEDQANRIMSIGQSMTFNVITNWWDGYDYVTPMLTTNKSGIIEIYDQVVTALNSGECKLIASYNGLTDSINIIVLPINDDIPGDVNGDGEVGIADINTVIDVILSGDMSTIYDVNHDGEINIADVMTLIDLFLRQ